MDEPHDETEHILSQVERAVVSVLTKAGIEPDYADRRQTRQQVQTLGESEKDAAFVFHEIQKLRQETDPETSVQRALIVMYAFMDAKYRHTGGVKLAVWRAGQKIGSEKANTARQEQAVAKWEPYRKEFKRLAGAKIKKAEAYRQIQDKMDEDEFWNPRTGNLYSDKTLRKHLDKSTE